MSWSQRRDNQDYQWLSKTGHAADGPVSSLAKKVGGGQSSQNKEPPAPPAPHTQEY